jgi:L-gulono-1,4-lactone dehydrogenase
MSTSRRAFLAGACTALLAPNLADASETCQPPKYLGWIGRREKKWSELLEDGGFVNYYGERFPFDERISLGPDSFPSCGVYGAVDSSLGAHGPLRRQLGAVTVGGAKQTSNCQLWPDQTTETFQARVKELYDELKGRVEKPGSQVRFTAVGSRHSSSDVYRRLPDGRAVVLHIEGLNQILPRREDWKASFEEQRPNHTFAMVGAGITICQLNEALWSHGLAIETQGSFDGQTLAGAISTGTHGAGAGVGSVGDSVEAVCILTMVELENGPQWVVLQIEPDPDEAISDPERFEKRRNGVPWRLVQDRRLFEAAVLTMGTFGIVVGYVMRLRSAYFLYETRIGRPWSEIQQNLAERAVTPPSGFSPRGWRYEVAVSPSPIRGSSDHACTEVYRDEWDYDLDYLSETREIPQKWLGDVTRNVNLGGSIGNVVADITSKGLVRGRRIGSFADRCYRVLKLGQGEFVQAWGTELMVPAERGAELVSWILRTNPERGLLKRGERRGTRLLNPFGVRFCTGRSGFLTPVRWKRGSEPRLVCTAELTEAVKDSDRRNLGERVGNRPNSKDIVASWAEEFIQEFGSDGRVHWGQVNGPYGPEQLAQGYAKEDVDAWFEAFRTLNPYGMFDTAFVVRLGFVARREAERARPALRYRGLGAPLVDMAPPAVRMSHPSHSAEQPE